MAVEGGGAVAVDGGDSGVGEDLRVEVLEGDVGGGVQEKVQAQVALAAAEVESAVGAGSRGGEGGEEGEEVESAFPEFETAFVDAGDDVMAAEVRGEGGWGGGREAERGEGGGERVWGGGREGEERGEEWEGVETAAGDELGGERGEGGVRIGSGVHGVRIGKECGGVVWGRGDSEVELEGLDGWSGGCRRHRRGVESGPHEVSGGRGEGGGGGIVGNEDEGGHGCDSRSMCDESDDSAQYMARLTEDSNRGGAELSFPSSAASCSRTTSLSHLPSPAPSPFILRPSPLLSYTCIVLVVLSVLFCSSFRRVRVIAALTSIDVFPISACLACTSVARLTLLSMSRPSPNKRRLSVGLSSADVLPKRTRSQQRKLEGEAHAALNRLTGALGPARFVLHLFLEDDDAARLMRVSRSVTAAVLVGFRFIQHTFSVDSSAQLHRLRAVYESQGLLITRMETLSSFNEPLEDGEGGSLLPPSLIALMLGEEVETSDDQEESMLDAVDAYQAHALSRGGYDEANRRSDFAQLMAELKWPFTDLQGDFDRSLPVGCLPKSLRFLIFPPTFNQPILPHSLPFTLLYLQMGERWDQRVDGGWLCESVRHVALLWPTDEDEEVGQRYGCTDSQELEGLQLLAGRELRLYSHRVKTRFKRRFRRRAMATYRIGGCC